MAPKPPRRRARGSRREPLSRERIVAAGLTLCDREGLQQLTLRRLATELGVKPMSIYTYVNDKESLLDAMYAQLLNNLAGQAPPTTTWQEELWVIGSTIHGFFIEHPRLLPLVMRPADPWALMPVLERLFSRMMAAGFELGQAMDAYGAVAGYAMGNVLFNTSLQPVKDTSARLRAFQGLVARLPPEHYPTLIQMQKHSREWDEKAAFEFGLRALLAGIESVTRISHAPP